MTFLLGYPAGTFGALPLTPSNPLNFKTPTSASFASDRFGSSIWTSIPDKTIVPTRNGVPGGLLGSSKYPPSPPQFRQSHLAAIRAFLISKAKSSGSGSFADMSNTVPGNRFNFSMNSACCSELNLRGVLYFLNARVTSAAFSVASADRSLAFAISTSFSRISLASFSYFACNSAACASERLLAVVMALDWAITRQTATIAVIAIQIILQLFQESTDWLNRWTSSVRAWISAMFSPFEEGIGVGIILGCIGNGATSV